MTQSLEVNEEKPGAGAPADYDAWWWVQSGQDTAVGPQCPTLDPPGAIIDNMPGQLTV